MFARYRMVGVAVDALKGGYASECSNDPQPTWTVKYDDHYPLDR